MIPFDLTQFHFVNAAGQPCNMNLQLTDLIKGKTDDPKWVCRATCDGKPVVIKLRHLSRLKMRLRAARGRSTFRREIANLSLATSRSLRVPTHHALGSQRSWGLPINEALILNRVEHRSTLRHAIEQGQRDQPRELGIKLLADIRHAGLADKDYGFHNILWCDNDQLVWLDLERVFESPPDDPTGTIATTASALSSWWLADSGNPSSYQQTYQCIIDTLPQPRGGWSAIHPAIHTLVQGKLAWHLRTGRIKHTP